jgi:hypothetical protein
MHGSMGTQTVTRKPAAGWRQAAARGMQLCAIICNHRVDFTSLQIVAHNFMELDGRIGVVGQQRGPYSPAARRSGGLALGCSLVSLRAAPHVRRMTIVTTAYRRKRPAPKRKPHALDELPMIVIGKRRPTGVEVPDMTPEEHQRRGDAAEALFRKITRAADNQG